MKSLNDQQSGFTTVGIATLAIVLIIVGIAGVGVYKSLNKSNGMATNTLSTLSPATPVKVPENTLATPVKTAQQYLTITEWGVKLAVDNNTSSMYYYVEPDLPNTAYLSIRTISDIAPNCAANKFSLGAISRLTKEEHTNALNDSSKGAAGTIQIGNYWYSYEHPQGACATPEQAAAIEKLLPNFDVSRSMFQVFNTLEAD